MSYINSTLSAAATFLPRYIPLQSTKSALSDVAPVLISADLWTPFDRAFTSVIGYPTSQFRWVPGTTPLATFKSAALTIAMYYVIIFGGREIMRSRPAFKLNGLFIIHNFYLTAISGGLLLLFAQQLIPGLWKNGIYDGICGQTGWSQKLLVLYYLNYLTKYLELLDTVFLVLKKKPLTFLHTYHHGATAMLCYTQLSGKTPVSWVPITLNLAVHVVMYWYYFQAARGVKIWWKKYITIFQISQFVLDLGFVYFATYSFYASHYSTVLPHMGTCGHEKQGTAAFTGCAILTSYLVLFIMFYLATYKKPQGIKKIARRASRATVPTMKESATATVRSLRAMSDALEHRMVVDEKKK